MQRTNLASLCNTLGAFAEAEALARAAEAEAERLDVRVAVRAARSNLGPALSRGGAPDEAIRVLRASLDDTRENDDHFTPGVTRLYLAEALQRLGDLPAAEAEARRALSALAAFRPYRCLATARLADVLLALGRIEEALDHARAAFDELSALGELEEGEAVVRVVYCEALNAGGAVLAARDALGTAHAQLLARAARFGEEGQRRRFLYDVPEHARTLVLAERWLEGRAGT